MNMSISTQHDSLSTSFISRPGAKIVCTWYMDMYMHMDMYMSRTVEGLCVEGLCVEGLCVEGLACHLSVPPPQP